jgi:hypothetical protein
LSQFEAFASDRPLNIQGIDSISAAIDNEFNQSSPHMQEPTDDNAPWTSTEQQSDSAKFSGADEEPWELNDSGEEVKTTIAAQKNDSYSNFFSNTQSSRQPPTKKFDHENNNEDSDEQNYDDYFSKQQQPPKDEDAESIEQSLSKTVRFDENINNVAVLTPKDSLERSESISIGDSDDNDDEEITPNFQTVSDRITDHINTEYKHDDDETAEVTIRNIAPRPDSHISLTESEDLPPPLPPLPPMNKKSSNSFFFKRILFIYLFFLATSILK